MYQKKNEYLQYVDQDIQMLDEVHFSITAKVLDETLRLYYKLLRSNGLYDDLQEVRKQSEYFEKKYKDELAVQDAKIKKLWMDNFEKKY